MPVCEWCGGPRPPSKGNRPRKYCSRQCNNQAWRKRQGHPPAALPVTPSGEQHMAALRVANERRLAAAAAKQRVREQPDTAAGMARLAVELEAAPTWPKALRVEQALTWPRRSMPDHRAALLEQAWATELTTIGKLTGRQVGVLCAALRDPAVWRV